MDCLNVTGRLLKKDLATPSLLVFFFLILTENSMKSCCISVITLMVVRGGGQGVEPKTTQFPFIVTTTYRARPFGLFNLTKIPIIFVFDSKTESLITRYL